MSTTGIRELDDRIFAVMSASEPHGLTFNQAYNIVMRQDELIREGKWERDAAERRKQQEIDLCWQQRREEV